MVLPVAATRRRDAGPRADPGAPRHRVEGQQARLRHAQGARRHVRRPGLVRGATEVRAGHPLRARPPRRASRGGGRQPAAGARRLDRRRRGRQGRALHHGGRLVPPADRLPGGQSRHAARQPFGAKRRIARRRKDVRGPDRRDHVEAAGHAAQGLRLRLDGDVDPGLRPAGGAPTATRERRWAR